MRASAALAVLAAVLASAQVNNYTSELEMTINPNTVQQGTRAVWCQGQTNTCNLLCNNNADQNSCSEVDLQWKCSCASNSSQPGIQYYRQTMPYYICTELFHQCISAHVGDARGQDGCKQNIQSLCAPYDPPTAAVPDSDSGASSSSSPSSTSASSTGGSSGGSAQATSTSKGFAAPTLAPAGNGAVAAALGLMAYLL